MNYAEMAIPFIGGLALFIYGMSIMAQGLEKAAGSKMKSILEALTQNKLMGIALGALVTAIVQSSSATTVMVVGFVNAGLMNLAQAMSVIMGANIGTTITGWLVSSSEWAKMFSPSTIAPLAVMLGVILMMSGKSAKRKEIASIVIGFGVLFIGIETMSSAVAPLKDSEGFRSMFVTLGSNPLLGIFAGAFVTAIIQSSSASQGILLSLAASGLVPFNAAVYIIMGQNIGTCVTALLSGIGATKTAKCVGYMHLMFNITGAVVFSILAIIYFTLINPAMGSDIISQTQISAIHTIFNIGTTLMVLPLGGAIIALAKKINHVEEVERKDESQLVHLDKRMLETPGLAVEGAKLETLRLGHIACENLQSAIEALLDKNHDKIEEVKQREKVVDSVCDSISEYLIKLCTLQISERDYQTVTSLLNTISDMERVGDHAENIAELAEEMERDQFGFSEKAQEELRRMTKTAVASYQNALKALETEDITCAMKTTVLEEQVDAMEKELRASHIERLSNAECNVNSGIHFLEMLGNLERVSDHAMNIAQVVLNEYREEKKYHEEPVIEEV
ncbi:Na/Pi cotransporter family protein [Anaerotignum lactatifermentans]|uniref:Na/Pi cotransporter family protein n=1 Tax=Anaerotignum lactatifermentans TaxID=160404 RepID=A0ABS2G6M2_9FIRM|nr:Na/Pi cotransporter family protein [Anaerotignum lactatifermentans]MBM6828065.1 Na/Pi cotransporter family protein [Anaerotignum lactatifermentans]MBM6876772.1 Na/Pi cotransporter family protein [Anaerotignum lactatifermentans]MBM6949648.1 Na/Pi cotransporter family protein [Anaerotignum lactatifermentans]